MSLDARSTDIAGVVIFEPKAFGDPRGYFLESWHVDRYAAAGLPREFVQDNVSRSAHGVLRGLHVQEPFGQGKFVQVLDGEVFDVAVDVRVGSPTFGRWVGVMLSAENHRQMYLPPGIAHGFCVMSASALLTYKCTDFYHPETEFSIAWNDPAIGIEWPVTSPTLSAKDAAAPVLAMVPLDRLPRWERPPLA